MRTPSPLPLLLPLFLLSACSIVVDVETEPVDQEIPVTSLGAQVFGEVAIDIPPEARGDIVEVTQLVLEAAMVNPAARSNLEFELRLSTEGEATPDAPRVYPALVAPDYVARAAVLVPATTLAPGGRQPVTIDGAPLREAVTTLPRIWLIAANTLTPAGIGLPDTLPLNLRLEDVVVKAQVVKSFEGASGAQGALGL